MGPHHRVWVVGGAIAIIGGSFAVYLRSPEMRFEMEKRDGQGVLTYFCKSGTGQADALARAEAAHTYFQDELDAITAASAASMQEAMVAANAAGTIPDFGHIEAARSDLIGATISVVDDLFQCRLGPGQIAR